MFNGKHIRATIAAAGAIILGVTSLTTIPGSNANASGTFNPGNIISDANMYTNGATMSVQEIQKFLNTQGQRCKTGNGKTCLKDFRQNTIAKAADQYCPRPFPAAKQQSAAQIIYQASQACNISTQVLLVTLQKEQGLITNAGTPHTYNRALGFACPDGAGGKCAADKAGFQNQVYLAARQLQRYRLRPNNYSFAAGRTSTVYYNYNKACGSTRITMENQATASLYNYTPYQPNPALLKGKADSCSSDGNLNFYTLYKKWFGDPQGTPKPVTKPVAPEVTPGNTGTQQNTKKQLEDEIKAGDKAVSESASPVEENSQPPSTPAPQPSNPTPPPTQPEKPRPALKIAAVKRDNLPLTAPYRVPSGTKIEISLSGLPAGKTPTVSLNDSPVKDIPAAAPDQTLAFPVTFSNSGLNTLKITDPDTTTTISETFTVETTPLIIESVKVNDVEIQPENTANPKNMKSAPAVSEATKIYPVRANANVSVSVSGLLTNEKLQAKLEETPLEPKAIGNPDGGSAVLSFTPKPKTGLQLLQLNTGERSATVAFNSVLTAPSIVLVSPTLNDDGEIEAGTKLDFNLLGLSPNTTPQVTFGPGANNREAPEALAISEVADATGTISGITYRLPLNISGLHNLVVRDAKTNLEKILRINVINSKTKSKPQVKAEIRKPNAEYVTSHYNPRAKGLAQTGSLGAGAFGLALGLILTGWKLRRRYLDNQPIRVNC